MTRRLMICAALAFAIAAVMLIAGLAPAQGIRPGLTSARGGLAPAQWTRARLAPALGPKAAPHAQLTHRAYVPNEVVVGYASGPSSSAATTAVRRIGAQALLSPEPRVEVLRLPAGISVAAAIARLRREPGVAYAVPNLLARIADRWVPDDPGRAHHADGWERMQWNFLGAAGVHAPRAWANLRADGRPGGRGSKIAVLDTGIAYRNWRAFRKSPDFTRTRFVNPYDFVAHNAYPLDQEGHGTFVTGTIAEATNNSRDLTGLAFGASIMPVRVLDANGEGDAATISRGIRYAVAHHAQVINLSLEFPPGTSSDEIPDVLGAVRYAHRHGAVVVAASGNDTDTQLAYPAAAHDAISVGATTRDRCLAEYSNDGSGLDLVAPGGGYDSGLVHDPNCHPYRNLPSINQLSLLDPPNWKRFGYPSDYTGTSMAAAHVSAIAAMVIASGVIGRHPTPDEVLHRLERTAQPLGGSQPNSDYGYGLVDAAAATAASTAGS